MHKLVNIRTLPDLEAHPEVGASWEGFVLEEVVRHLGVRHDQCFFWATHGGAELDFLVMHGRQRLGVEFKRTPMPKLTPSIRNALVDLKLSELTVIHAGDHSFPLSERVRSVVFARLLMMPSL